MSAPKTEITAPGDAQEAAEALTLLEALARAPAAAALVVAALKGWPGEDLKALRLAHPQLRDAVGEATIKLRVIVRHGAAAVRPPTPRRWPCLKELNVFSHDLAAVLEAIRAGAWGCLHALRLGDSRWPATLDVPAARALAAALRQMPALRALKLEGVELPDAAAQELFRASSAAGAPQLRGLTIWSAGLSPAAARMLVSAGWPLQELDLRDNRGLGAAGLAVLAAAPTFALRRLKLVYCGLDAAALLSVANAPWPLEELVLSGNDFSAAAAGPALAALARHHRLRGLDVGQCQMSAAGFKALVEAHWPALTYLRARGATVEFDGPRALGAAAFAGFPALKELDLSGVALGEAGARLLASRRWPRLRELNLFNCRIGDAGLAAFARGAWPALRVLYLRGNDLGAALALDDTLRWAPALVDLHV